MEITFVERGIYVVSLDKDECAEMDKISKHSISKNCELLETYIENGLAGD